RSTDLGWRADSERRLVLSFYEDHGTLSDPLAHEMAARYEAGVGRTHRREELVEDRAWYASAFCAEVSRGAGVDHAIYAVRPRARTGQITGLGITRPIGDRAFDDHELVFAHIFFHDLMPQLALAQRSESRLPRLSPRERDTLDGLLDGLSEKE